MAYLLTNILTTYNYLMTERADSRAHNLMLMSSLIPLVIILLVYMYVVKNLGPKLMENRKSFNIDKFLIGYNVFQMLCNTYILWQAGSVIIRKFNWHCNEIDYSDDPDAVQLLHAVHNYFLTKVIDLFDTVFFVLRKKQSQITFLHVYHHTLMLVSLWMVTKYIGGGHMIPMVAINNIVHIAMYGYYMVTVWNKKLRSNHIIKRRITELQLLQFFIGVTLSIPIQFNGCNYPRVASIYALVQGLIFIWLFGCFYYSTYLKRKRINID